MSAPYKISGASQEYVLYAEYPTREQAHKEYAGFVECGAIANEADGFVLGRAVYMAYDETDRTYNVWLS